jgi:hypothetical protein
MIFDHRTYQVRPGTLPKQIALYKEFGYAAQARILGEPLLFATTDVGNVNSYVHIWAYKDIAERAVKRAAMQADPDWQAYLKKSAEAGYLINQENKILMATDLSA